MEAETWAGACVDYLQERADINPGRIGIVGWSLGGYYAPRAAAFEKRFALCACWGANYNWGELQRRRAQREGENPVPHYWEHVQWVWGQKSFEEFLEFAPRVTLENVASEITVPFLVAHGEGDRQIPLEYARAQFDGATASPHRELRILTERDGGVEHVGGDACLRLRDEGLIPDELMQFSLVLGVVGGMAATPENLLTMVRRLPDNAVWQVIAIGRRNLELTAMGLALGGNARAGLEDTLYLRKGELSEGSQPLVERTVTLARSLDLPVATVDESATRLGIATS